jgi:hypothetical protein
MGQGWDGRLVAGGWWRGGGAQPSIASVAGGSGRVGASGWPISDEGRQATSAAAWGPCRTEGDLLGEHVPDGLGQLAGDLDAGDGRAALAAEPPPGGRVVVAVEGWRPAWVAASISAHRSHVGPFLLKGRAGRGGRTGTPAGTARCRRTAWWVREPGDVAQLGGDGGPQHPGDTGADSSRGTYGWSAPSRRSSCSQPWIWASRSSMSATAAAVVPPPAGQPQPGPQRSTASAEQVADRARPPQRQQGGVHPVLERHPVPTRCSRHRAAPALPTRPGPAARAPGPGRGGTARPAPRRGAGRSCRPAGPAPLTFWASAIWTSIRPARAGRGRSGRRSSTRSPPTPAGRTCWSGGPSLAGRRRLAVRWCPGPAGQPRSAHPPPAGGVTGPTLRAT